MVITLKIFIIIIMMALALVGYTFMRDFKSSLSTDLYENSSLLAKLMNKLVFILISACIIGMFSFFLKITFSTITIY